MFVNTNESCSTAFACYKWLLFTIVTVSAFLVIGTSELLIKTLVKVLKVHPALYPSEWWGHLGWWVVACHALFMCGATLISPESDIIIHRMY